MTLSPFRPSRRLRASIPKTLVLAGLCMGCSGGPPTETDPPPPTPCGDSPPTIADVTVIDAGPMDFDGTTWPSLRIDLNASDPDGALTSWTIRAAYDDDIDQIVDFTADGQAGNGSLAATGSFGPHDCSVTSAELFMHIAVNGEPAPGRYIELGVVLEDADGNASDPPVFVEILTPEE